MKLVKMRKSVFVSSIVVSSLLFGTVGVFAGNGVEAIKAKLNHDIKFVLNGSKWTPKDQSGNNLSALVYNGSTYVPLRSVSEALGADVNFDGASLTISIDGSGDSGIPYKDTSTASTPQEPVKQTVNPTVTNTPPPAATTATASANGGKTLSSAIPVGKSVTFNDPYSYDGLTFTGNYTVSVSSVKSISRSEIAILGFREPEANALIEYKLAKVKIVMNNGKIISDDKNEGTYVAVDFVPQLWGSKTSDGDSIIGVKNSGFTGSLDDAIRDATDLKKLKSGESYSYTAEGLVIVPVHKGVANYLAVQLRDNSDYDKSFFYFNL
ncbi:stalk domain-containing protein [Paenibacillus sp. FSL R7-0204]|uniref:stalk domain-containing protein n=1 Tax=Paenibacillus sp. FSL R7-0204 TaxID=2921675 RepID=UPI0030FA11C6